MIAIVRGSNRLPIVAEEITGVTSGWRVSKDDLLPQSPAKGSKAKDIIHHEI